MKKATCSFPIKVAKVDSLSNHNNNKKMKYLKKAASDDKKVIMMKKTTCSLNIKGDKVDSLSNHNNNKKLNDLKKEEEMKNNDDPSINFLPPIAPTTFYVRPKIIDLDEEEEQRKMLNKLLIFEND